VRNGSRASWIFTKEISKTIELQMFIPQCEAKFGRQVRRASGIFCFELLDKF
jgi:hypothetical protein